MNAALVMFCFFVGITLVITWWASARTTTSKGFYAAHREIGGVQNGWAVAGDYMSAASFLGITGLIAFYGFDGFMYSVGFLVAYLTALFLVAEPLRNVGKYTMADLISFRLHGKGVRAIAAISTLVVALFYMIAQMVGAGSLVDLLLPSASYTMAIVVVGALMIIYVMFGGMLATTWVQIIKAALLLAGAVAITIMVLAHYSFSLPQLFTAAANVAGPGGTTTDLLRSGLLYAGQHGALNLLSLGLALVLGTAGLPHILMRFYTVPTARAARTSVAWAMVLIGIFYLTTMFMGLGAATLVGKADIGTHVKDAPAIAYISRQPAAMQPVLNAELKTKQYIVPTQNNNMAAPLLANYLGGAYFMAFIAAVAFATILAVVAGLTISASSAFAHDIWWNIVRKGKGDEREQLRVARATAALVGVVAILLSIGLRTLNVAFLVGLAFAVAASANVPVIVLSLSWRRFNKVGAIAGMVTGLVSSLGIIAISPAIMGIDPAGSATHHFIQMAPLFPLDNPGLLSIPLGFIGAILGTFFSRDAQAEADFDQLLVRANTGMGAEV